MTIRKGRKIIAGNGAAAIATIQNPGLVQPDGQTISITEDGIITANVPEIDTSNLITKDSIATNDVVGLVKPDGTTITIDEEGRISSNLEIPEVSVATAETTGVVKPDGETITITEDGVISSIGIKELPVASADVLGCVKVDGETITILDGVLSLAGGGDYSIVEAYVSGTSGYNLYANGYCEQWGQSNNKSVITFSKPFKDTNYNLLLGMSDSTGVADVGFLDVGATTNTNFTYAQVNAKVTQRWRACGYIS